MQLEPKITIITINFNNAAGLEKTIRSVVDQTYQNIEYIVVDGGSTDRSRQVIDEFEYGIHVRVIEPDSGIYNAMNKGIKRASGDYLLFLNSGDWLSDNAIVENVVSEKLEEDIVYGDLLFHDTEKEWVWNLPSQLTLQTFFTSTIAHPSSFIRKRLFDIVGLYDERLNIVSDWKFFLLAITKYNCSYKHIDYIVSSYSFDGISSQSKNIPIIKAEREKILLEEFPRMVNDYNELISLKEEMNRNKFLMKISRKIRGLLNA